MNIRILLFFSYKTFTQFLRTLRIVVIETSIQSHSNEVNLMFNKRVWIILLIALLGLFIGFSVGGYLTTNRVMRAVEQIPASPIVLDTVYDKDHNQLALSIMNPGPMPLHLENHTITFTPGSETEEAAYVVSNIPMDVTIPPFEVAIVVINLKENTADLQLGDLVTVSVFYTHPLSPDVYTVIHPYTYQQPAAQPQSEATPAS